MKDELPTRVFTLHALSPGDYVEAFDKRGNHLQGIVDVTADEHGVLWIHTFLGERKLLDMHEHEVRLMDSHRLRGLRS